MKSLKRLAADLYWLGFVARKAWKAIREMRKDEPIIGIIADIKPLNASNLTDMITNILKDYTGALAKLEDNYSDLDAPTDWHNGGDGYKN